MDIIKKLNWRYACKKFDTTKKVSDSDIQTIAESLRLTASSFGLQLWNFKIVENQDILNKLVEHSWGQKQIAEASHLVVFCRPKHIDESVVDDFVKDIAETRKQDIDSLEGYANMMKGFIKNKDDAARAAWMKNQLYIALGNLLTVAATLDIDSCPMEGIIPSKYDEVLGLAEQNLTTVVACPLGYRSSDDKYAESAKVRYPLEKVVDFIR